MKSAMNRQMWHALSVGIGVRGGVIRGCYQPGKSYHLMQGWHSRTKYWATAKVEVMR